MKINYLKLGESILPIPETCYFTIRGGSLKKIAKKIIPKVPTNKKVYTNASIKNSFPSNGFLNLN